MVEQLLEMPSGWERAVVIVAHPDDVEYGMAGAVAAWTDAGREVGYVMVSSGEAGIAGLDPELAGPIREAEQRRGAELVGVRDVEFLRYPDGTIAEGVALRADLTEVLRRRRPELVLTVNHHDYWGPGRWNTPDHRAVGRAVLDAATDAGNEWLFRTPGLRAWPGVRWVGVNASPLVTHAVDVSATLDRAVASLTAHATYLAALTDQDPHRYATDLLTGAATAAADRFGGRPAVTFELVDR